MVADTCVGTGAAAVGGGLGAGKVAGVRWTSSGGTVGTAAARWTGGTTIFTFGGVTRRGAALDGLPCGLDKGIECQILIVALERTFCCQVMLMNRAPMNNACKPIATTPATTGIGSESASLRNHATSRIGSIVPRVPAIVLGSLVLTVLEPQAARRFPRDCAGAGPWSARQGRI